MKPLLAILIITPFLYCSTTSTVISDHGHTYQYHYKMTAPVASKDLSFVDSNITAKFSITASGIIIVIKNNTPSSLRLDWEDAAIVQYGSNSKIIHKGIKYKDRGKPMAPTTIAPQSGITDMVLPVENVSQHGDGYYSRVDWSALELYPIHDNNKAKTAAAIMSNIGQDLSLYLPIKAASGKEIGYYFTFHVKDIVCIDCEDLSVKKKK